LIKIH